MNKPWVAVRCWNDAWVLEETLRALRCQSTSCRVMVFDNESTDGSTEIAMRMADRVVNVPRGTYVPGRVLNAAMRETDGEFVTFLNSDCTPQHGEWLERLLAGVDAPGVAAVFGRQVPRPGCRCLFAKDTEETFGDGARQAHWRHCFSMASSAIRRSVWEAMPFREDIQYSEDIDWTWRARGIGHAIRYVAGSVVAHSHNYTLKQYHRRQYGEGRADAAIFDWSPWDASLLRYSLMPLGRQIVSDCRHAAARGEFGAILHSPALRIAQMLGRRRGFVEGMKARYAS